MPCFKWNEQQKMSFVFFVQMKKDVKQKNESFVFKYYQNQNSTLVSGLGAGLIHD